MLVCDYVCVYGRVLRKLREAAISGELYAWIKYYRVLYDIKPAIGIRLQPYSKYERDFNLILQNTSRKFQSVS